MSPTAPLWHISCVYGEPRTENRHLMWQHLSSLRQSSTLPWVVLGDFNEALWQFEHLSKNPRSEIQMQAFRDVLDVCNLIDLGFEGNPFTYDNRRKGSNNVQVRLDRVVADESWRDIFSAAHVVHLVSPCSDHVPILLRLLQEENHNHRKKCRHYEIMWEREAELPHIISAAWEAIECKTDLGNIEVGLDKVMSDLHTWGSRKFGNVVRKIEKLRKKLGELQYSNSDQHEIRKITDEMNELLYREEMLWLQRSRIDWLKEGDRNTKFFHGRAVWRSRKNKIEKLKAADGNVYSNQETMGTMATNYFKELFTKDPNLVPANVANLFAPQVSSATNEALCADFSEEEISTALFQIGPIKAPGPDGFPARFFQRNWGLFKDNIVQAVKKFLDTGQMPEGVNHTTIVLIPKVDQPVEMKDFRPISLCNVLYKIVSKCLVNRLRPLLGDIISPNQSAFVQGRMITDNALIAFECKNV